MPLAVVVRTQITYRDGGSEEGVKLERLPASIDETTRVFRSRSPIQTSVLIVPAGFAHDKSGVVDFVNVGWNAEPVHRQERRRMVCGTTPPHGRFDFARGSTRGLECLCTVVES